MMKRYFWLVVALAVSLAPAAAYAATPTRGSGGGGSGGVIDSGVLALFEFSVDNDVLHLDRLAWWSGVASEPDAEGKDPDCEYSGVTAGSEGLSYIDLGRSLVIRVEGAKASCGTVFAELEVIYRDRYLNTSPIVDQECDGDLRRGKLLESSSAIASVYIETATDGLIIEAAGSATYSYEQFVCVDAARVP